MAKTKEKSKDLDEDSELSSLEEVILRMRFNLSKEATAAHPAERDIADDLRKKLQFLELKAFEQSGRINELLSDMKKK